MVWFGGISWYGITMRPLTMIVHVQISNIVCEKREYVHRNVHIDKRPLTIHCFRAKSDQPHYLKVKQLLHAIQLRHKTIRKY